MIIEDILRKCLLCGSPFCLYRLPGESEGHFLYSGKVSVLDSLEEIGNEGFLFTPFVATEECKRLYINFLHKCTLKTESRKNTILDANQNLILDKSVSKEYALKFGIFSEKIKAGEYSKLVLSRQMQLSLVGEPDIIGTFLNACNAYKDVFIYVFYSLYSGLWLGCSPEILLTKENNVYHTVALAGTRVPSKEQSVWDAKNIREQGLVASYIREKLKDKSYELSESKPYTVRAGHLEHLKTDFCFSSHCSAGKLISCLYPTPAVCGLPEIKARNFIYENESKSRKYYSGLVGIVGENMNIYVNLRCAQIDCREATLYSGSGIMPSSSMEAEWCETGEKMCTVANILICK